MSKSMVGRIPTKEDTGPGSVGWGECCGNPLRGCAKCPPPKKLTFEEWAVTNGFGHWYAQNKMQWAAVEISEELLRSVWQAAQENVPSQAPGTGA